MAGVAVRTGCKLDNSSKLQKSQTGYQAGFVRFRNRSHLIAVPHLFTL
jgi:hypothetical protein